MSADSHSFNSFSALLRQALGGNLITSAETLLDMLAEDICFEFPFALPGGVQKLEGKPQFSAYLSRLAPLLTLESMSLSRVILTADKRDAVLEFSCKGYNSQSGTRYDQQYISLIELKDGLISGYRDYWNPLILMAAFNDINQLNTTLKGASDDQ